MQSSGCSFDTTLEVSPDCLIFFLDETGHELLADPRFPVFGLGGCAVLASDLDRVVRDPWREMKAASFGGAKVALHAAKLSDSTKTQLAALGQFFRHQAFFRLASVIKDLSVLPPDLPPYAGVSLGLLRRIGDVVGRCKPAPREVALVFEESERGSRLIAGCFGEAGATVFGIQVPVHLGFMPKSVGETGLEVADFIMHAAGCQVRRKREGRSDWRLDFRAIFQEPDRSMVSYMEIGEIAAKA